MLSDNSKVSDKEWCPVIDAVLYTLAPQGTRLYVSEFLLHSFVLSLGVVPYAQTLAKRRPFASEFVRVCLVRIAVATSFGNKQLFE